MPMELVTPFSPNSVPLTPINFLERAAIAYTDSPSLVDNNNNITNNTTISYTWDQTHRRCIRVASAIKSLGINRGDVVSVLAPNIPAMYELQFSVPMAGAILSNLNTCLDPRTLSILLRHSESKLVFVDHHFKSLLKALSMLPHGIPRPIIILIKDQFQDQDDDNIDILPISNTTGNETIVASYKELVEGGDSRFDWVRPRSEWDPMALNYTSGTTNSPKGVVLSHRGNYILTMDTLLGWSVPKKPVYLWTLPMFHANGWSLTWGMAAVGGTNVCLRKIVAPIVYDAIQHHGVTHLCGAPVVLNMLANLPSVKPLQTPVHVLTGGAPTPASVLIRSESLGFVISHGYGLTETGGAVVISGWKSEWDHLSPEEQAKMKARQVGSLGMTKLDVVDPKTGQPVKRDGLTLGEIVLKGGSLMLGYLKDPEATSKSMTETGWFRTGDVGVIHPDGYLEVMDRLKDMIINGGENVYSVEVEAVLYTHPKVNEAAVVARPHDLLGETPCAFLSLKGEGEGELSEKEVIEYCRKRMAHYMVPKKVVFQDELPKTSTGKVQKFLLREIAKTL